MLWLTGVDGVEVRHKVAEGATPEINRRKLLNAAAANYVHSLDASHLVKIVNAANAEGINNILTVHDSFSCLATQATRFNQIIREQLVLMYENNPLADLHARNAVGTALTLPDLGDLDPREVLNAQPFM
jgi:DNA-directed RNA polymerase